MPNLPRFPEGERCSECSEPLRRHVNVHSEPVENADGSWTCRKCVMAAERAQVKAERAAKGGE